MVHCNDVKVIARIGSEGYVLRFTYECSVPINHLVVIPAQAH